MENKTLTVMKEYLVEGFDPEQNGQSFLDSMMIYLRSPNCICSFYTCSCCIPTSNSSHFTSTELCKYYILKIIDETYPYTIAHQQYNCIKLVTKIYYCFIVQQGNLV